MNDRSSIMKAAWAQYRRMTRYSTSFDRKLFADVLGFTWAEAKRRARYAAEAEARRAAAVAAFNADAMANLATAPMSELEQLIDGLKYMSARYDIGRMAMEMRAEHARQMGAGQ